MDKVIHSEYRPGQNNVPIHSEDSRIQKLNEKINEVVSKLKTEQEEQTILCLQRELDLTVSERNKLLERISELKDCLSVSSETIQKSKETICELKNAILEANEAIQNSNKAVQKSNEEVQTATEAMIHAKNILEKTKDDFTNATIGFGTGAVVALFCTRNREASIATVAFGAILGLQWNNIATIVRNKKI